MKRLNGIAHDFGHHAVSGLGYLTAHLFKACATAGRFKITVQIYPLCYPDDLRRDVSLEMALKSSNQFFCELLHKQRLDIHHVRSASLSFVFIEDWPETKEIRRILEVSPRPYASDPAYRCKSVVVAANDRTYSHDFASWHYNSA